MIHRPGRPLRALWKAVRSTALSFLQSGEWSQQGESKSFSTGSNKAAARSQGMQSFSGKQRGWSSFLGLPPVVLILPTLLLSALCHWSPRDSKKFAQKCKTALFMKGKFSKQAHSMSWLESSERTTRKAKVWNKRVLRFGTLRHSPLPIRGAPRSISSCLYRLSMQMFLPLLRICKGHTCEESFCPTGEYESTSRKHSKE